MTEHENGLSDAEKMREFQEERERAHYQILEENVRRLRRGMRGLTFGFVLVLGLYVVTIFRPDLLGIKFGPEVSELLRVRHLVLEDPSGVTRGEWRVDEEGNARFSLQDRRGKVRLSLSVLSGGSPGLSLIDDADQRRAALALLPDGTTNLVLADGSGRHRAVLGLSPADATHLVFADAQGSIRVALGLDGTGVGTFMIPEEAPEGEAPGDPEG